MANISITYGDFVAGTVISSSQIDQNFDDIINGLTDGTKDIVIAGFTSTSINVLSGANSLFSVTSAGLVTIGVTGSGALSHVVNGLGFTLQGVTAGSTTAISADHSDNTNTASHAKLVCESGGASGGDPFVHMSISGVANFSIGIDNDQADVLAISAAATLGTNIVTLTSTGILTLIGEANIQSGLDGLVVGADLGATTLTTNTNKGGRVVQPHYDNTEEHMLFLYGTSTSGANTLRIGGGFASYNAATSIDFYTGATTTTTTGTLRGQITAAGSWTIGTASGTESHRLNMLAQTTVGAAGAASALPATPEEYVVFNVNGNLRAIPCYLAS